MALLAFALSGDGEYTVEDFDIDILLLETGELEGGCHAIGFVVDVKVEPTMGGRSQYCVEGFLGSQGRVWFAYLGLKAFSRLPLLWTRPLPLPC